MKLNEGNFTEANNKLQNDLLKKMDGFAVGNAVDKDDFIVDIDSQKQIYPLIAEVISIINDLM